MIDREEMATQLTHRRSTQIVSMALLWIGVLGSLPFAVFLLIWSGLASFDSAAAVVFAVALLGVAATTAYGNYVVLRELRRASKRTVTARAPD